MKVPLLRLPLLSEFGLDELTGPKLSLGATPGAAPYGNLRSL